MSQPAIRDELVATLEDALRLQQRLLAAARDKGVPVADLVAQVSTLERLDDRRDELIGQLRRTASADSRADRSSPPIREIVLGLLLELRWPQNAGFLEEYLFARRGLHVDSRAFAPLRRDERRAWERSPGAREAYIVPALNPDGTANPHWISRSDWPLYRRIVASAHTERLFDLQKVYSLAGRPGSPDASARGSPGPSDVLLDRYALQYLQIEPRSVSASPEAIAEWREKVREQVEAAIAEIRRHDEPERKQIAATLASLPAAAQLWGVDPVRGGR